MEKSVHCINGHNIDNITSSCTTCGATTVQSHLLASVTQDDYSPMAIASVTLGVLWIYWIGSVLALIFGYVALRNIKRTGQLGNRMASAGIFLGWVGLALLLTFVILRATGLYHGKPD
jgi:hypothetical protein